jgi:FkbM family methyltransferase
MVKAVGPKGYYLGLCRSLRWMPFAIKVPIFGKVSTVSEILNIHDNFAVGELRDHFLESVLRRARSPVIVDCGINVGITVRWWLHLNRACQIFGLDMMQEAHDFTCQALPNDQASYHGITAAISAVDGEEVSINFDNPLEGTNALDSARTGAQSRRFLTARVDTVLAPHHLTQIVLLKVDLEGHAAKALAGAGKTLSLTNNVILEAHSEAELGESEAILVNSGFRLRNFRNRNLWFVKKEIAGRQI